MIGVIWKVHYVVDYTGQRNILELLETKDPQDFTEVGKVYSVKLATPDMNLEEVKRKRLLNVGLLSIEAYSSESKEKLVTVNMVVHVSKDKTDETKLIKTVLNPLE